MQLLYKLSWWKTNIWISGATPSRWIDILSRKIYVSYFTLKCKWFPSNLEASWVIEYSPLPSVHHSHKCKLKKAKILTWAFLSPRWGVECAEFVRILGRILANMTPSMSVERAEQTIVGPSWHFSSLMQHVCTLHLICIATGHLQEMKQDFNNGHQWLISLTSPVPEPSNPQARDWVCH